MEAGGNVKSEFLGFRMVCNKLQLVLTKNFNFCLLFCFSSPYLF